jgi:hypothetical protein
LFEPIQLRHLFRRNPDESVIPSRRHDACGFLCLFIEKEFYGHAREVWAVPSAVVQVFLATATSGSVVICVDPV